MPAHPEVPTDFSTFGLPQDILRALEDVGYETPTPVQAQVIPLMLEGRDVIGQAQTGTGKTAAFALPLLTTINLKKRSPQVLVLTPTRELAIQVSEAFHRYAAHLTGFHVVPIYGGQAYEGQLRHLRRGVHVVVGTPGRVMDHMRRKSLRLHDIDCLVLDEADEMLRMGFLEDVEWILDRTPPNRRITLFSATLPRPIRKIAAQYLQDPVEVTIKEMSIAAETIRQRYWMVRGIHKLDALTRILEAEPFESMIVFVRTKTETVDLVERLEARGFLAEAINGDIVQANRERTIERLKEGKLDILVATDVAARGLDVGRVSHVINYDVPYDTEAYVHRIGRTGRAGNKGEAILFVAPRERRILQMIERATRQRLEPLELPTTETINDKRIESFKQRIRDTLETEDLAFFTDLVEQYRREHDTPILEIAAALGKMVQGERPLLLQNKPVAPEPTRSERRGRPGRGERGPRESREEGRPEAKKAFKRPEEGMERFRIEVGQRQGVSPGNIVGAIANEAGINSRDIGWIGIYDDYSTVDLPEGMPKEIFTSLKKTRISGHLLRISSLAKGKKPEPRPTSARPRRPDTSQDPRGERPERPRRGDQVTRDGREEGRSEARKTVKRPDEGMERFRIEVGQRQGVSPGSIVGAIANEAGLTSRDIGWIGIYDDYSTVDLPEGMPKEIFKSLKKTRISGHLLRISRLAKSRKREMKVGRTSSSGRTRHSDAPRDRRNSNPRSRKPTESPHRRGVDGKGKPKAKSGLKGKTKPKGKSGTKAKPKSKRR